MRGAERKPFGADDFDVADAEEGEDRAQILLLEVVRLERHSRCVKTAAQRGNDHMLAAGQAGRPVRRVAECLAAIAMWSIHALSWLGMPKLYIGAPMTRMSALRNSSSTSLPPSSAIPTAPAGAFAGRPVGRRLRSRCGIGLASRSRRITSRPGIAAFSAATNAAES